jgi:hypothetical protein
MCIEYDWQKSEINLKCDSEKIYVCIAYSLVCMF